MTAGDRQRQEVEAIRRRLRHVREVLEAAEQALETITSNEPSPSEEPVGADWEPQWGTVGQAQRLRGCSHETMVAHIQRFGLGSKVAGRWAVDLRRVRAWIEGLPYPPIATR